MSTFEVKINEAGKWFWHERSRNGRIMDVSQAYTRKDSAVHAARKKVARTPGSKLKIIEPDRAACALKRMADNDALGPDLY